MKGKRRSIYWVALCLLFGGVMGARGQDLQISGKIVFAPYRGGEYHIYTMNPDGTGQTQLTTTGRQQISTWSPDGTKIAYNSNQDGNDEIYVMNADGTGQTRLTNNSAVDNGPSWSPDGTKIVFYSTRDGNPEIYMMNADGTGQTRLVSHSADDVWPSWSPDGAKIAFMSNRDGNFEIYVMNADGTGSTNLTNNSASDNNPLWSPDGTQIVFFSYRSGSAQIHVMNADGTGVTQLTSTGTNYNASWSPDGTKIAFETPRDGGGTAAIYVMDANGANQVRLVSNPPAIDGNPTWAGAFRRIGSTSGAAVSRTITIDNKGTATLTVSNITSSDGQFSANPTSFSVAAGGSQDVTITFTPTSTGTKYSTLTITSNDLTSPTARLTVNATATGVAPAADLQIRGKIAWNGNTVIRTMEADGSSQTSTGVSGRSPDWSPDGTKIVYSAGNNIYVMNADGSSPTELPTTASNDDYPAWSPDGTKIAWENNASGNNDIWVMDAADGGNKVNLSNNSAGHDWYPAWSPDGSKIAFASNRDGNTEIYVMNADGSNQTRLTNNSATDHFPAWSPDGSKISFGSNRDGNWETYVMNPDGSNQTRLTNNATSEQDNFWSPDGTKIVYYSNADLYVMNADGSSPVSLGTSTTSDEGPSWATPYRIGSTSGAPVSRTITIDNKGSAALTVSNITSSDGQFAVSPTNFSVPAGGSQNVTVTFTPTSVGTKYSTLTITSNDLTSPTARLTVNGTATGVLAADLQIRGKITWNLDTEIYVMNADGSGQTNLTNNGVADSSPAWSPDGTKVVFTTRRDGTSEIYTMNADGGSPTRLTNDSVNADDYASWSPDGTKVIFETGRAGNSEIYSMSATDGSGLVNLTNSSSNEFDPDWSPDGTKIAFASDRNGNREIYVMNADGSGQINLTNNSALDHQPSWSPDGTKIAFASYRDGNAEIYVMNADGTNQTRLTNNSADDDTPSWSPDGTKIIFHSLRNGNREIYVMNADGSGQTNLTNSAASDQRPSWDTPYRIGSTSGAVVFRTITIDNKGSAPLNVSNITSDNSQFTISPTSFSVPAGGSQEVTVTFTPTSVGTKYSTLTITSNDATSPTARLTVNGTGQGQFAEVGASAGVNNSANGSGVAWGDYDGDGDQDFYVSNFGSSNRLYRNNGDGTFTEVGSSAGVNDSGNGLGIAWGDYDNDGDLDLYVSKMNQASLLYRNNGNGTFAEIGSSAGVSNSGTGHDAGWGDYDNDGDLDLYVTSRSGGPNRLYQNNGNGTFTEVGSSAGVANAGGDGLNMVWGDYDNDGDQDIYLVNLGPNRLYQNSGNGTFTEVGSSAGVADGGYGAGAAWGDYDNDGDLDLYLVNQSGGTNRLYRNSGNGTFTEVGSSAGVADTGDGRGGVWGDYDNDGDLDLYVVKVGVSRLYRNSGDGTFTEVGASAGVNNSGGGQGGAWGDYDGDGDLDFYLVNYGSANVLYRNNGNTNRWLTVKLVGTTSNRNGIGARVTAVTGPTRQRRDVEGGSGFFSQPSLPVEFGFGGVSTVDSLIVRWPSGAVQVQTNVATDQVLTVTEPVPPAPGISLSASSLSLGSATVGATATAVFSVANTGGAALNVTGIVVGGADAGQFTVSPSTFTVAVGDSAAVTVSFAPTSAGAKTASLSIHHNAAGSPASVALSGTGALPPPPVVPGISLSASSLSLGSANVGATGMGTFTITNTGTASLSVTGITVGGTDASQFSVSPTTATVAAGDSLRVTVTFAPTSAGAKAASLSIHHNAAGSPSSVSLSGTGVPRETRLWVKCFAGARQETSPLRIRVGRAVRFEVWAFTAPDSSDLRQLTNYTWQVPPRLGKTTGLGRLELTTVAGINDTILFQAQGARASFRLITTPHSIERLAIEPAAVTLTPGQKQSFRARAYDQYGNEVSGKSFGWHAVGGIGTIDPHTGVFEAARQPGEGYVIAVVSGVIVFGDAAAGIEGSSKVVVKAPLPARFALGQNTPNPFNPGTLIGFELPVESRVRLRVYNLSGQLVAELVDQVYPAGVHQVEWQPVDLPSGVYIYQLEAGAFRTQRKMTLLR